MNKPINIQSFVCEIDKCPDIQRLKEENEKLKTWLLDTSLDEVYWPCSHSRAIPSFPSQLEAEKKRHCLFAVIT